MALTVPQTATNAEEQALANAAYSALGNTMGLPKTHATAGNELLKFMAYYGTPELKAVAAAVSDIIRAGFLSPYNRIARIYATIRANGLPPIVTSQATLESRLTGAQYLRQKPWAYWRLNFGQDDGALTLDFPLAKIDDGAHVGDMSGVGALPFYTPRTFHSKAYYFESQQPYLDWSTRTYKTRTVSGKSNDVDCGNAMSGFHASLLNLLLLRQCNGVASVIGEIDTAISEISSLIAQVGVYADDVLAASPGWDEIPRLTDYWQVKFPGGVVKVAGPDGVFI
jgi:hypothetical protein